MNFNFYEEYLKYPAVELLKITRQPASYQGAALEAAKRVLAERNISETDTEAVNQYFNDIATRRYVQQEKINTYTNKATDILEPLVKPSKEVEPAKWLNIFLLFISILYAWVFYSTIRSIISFINCRECKHEAVTVIQWLPLLYTPVMIFLLFKKKRWGWILLFADNLFTVISQICSLYFFFKFQSLFHSDIFSVISPIVLRTFLAIFLWKGKIAGLFNITEETKKKTTIITSLGTIFFIVVLNLMY